jgi:hypothetical protein
MEVEPAGYFLREFAVLIGEPRAQDLVPVDNRLKDLLDHRSVESPGELPTQGDVENRASRA